MATEQTTPEIVKAAENLKSNRFLPIVLTSVKADIIQTWQAANTSESREECWQRLQVLEYVAGAIRRECERAINRGGDA